MKIKKNDTVLIITGKDRGKKGNVLMAYPDDRKVMVEGVNIIKKHRRPRQEKEKGQVIEMPKPIAVSNVKLICPKCSQATRVGYRLTENGKNRICKKCEQEV